jgi:uncharacterized protein (TIRG00374 family)
MSKTTLRFIILFPLGLVLLLSLWRHIGFDAVFKLVRNVSPVWFFFAVAAELVFLSLRSLRWRMLLSPVKNPVRLSNLFAIGVVGDLFNILIPLRVGEVLKASILNKKEDISFASGFASIVSERILDFSAITAIGIVAMFLLPIETELPGLYVNLLWLCGASSLLILILLMITIRRRWIATGILRRLCNMLPKSLGNHILRFGESFLAGAMGLGMDIRALLLLLACSGFVWIMPIISHLMWFKAFSVDIPISLVALAGALLVLTRSLPAPPIHLGTYEAYWMAVYAGLGLQLDRAFTIGMATHMTSTFLTAMLAGLSIPWLGLNLREAFKMKL